MPRIVFLAPFTHPGRSGVVYGAGHQVDTDADSLLALQNKGQASLVSAGASPISAVVATPAATTCTITWTTPTQTDGRVDYGLTSAYTGFVQDIAVPVTSHSLQITGLVSGTTYHYALRSMSGSIWAATPDATFTTL